ncbi:MAG: SpoIIE family protein phosphatase [Flavobacteriaceae bacterium]|nr:SpoIIE family protein phosphatase [Flavobacteriales bacterium]MDG1380155.1 SpoIIE family protein phosphatase [Flavobacteriaceae bacterium]
MRKYLLLFFAFIITPFYSQKNIDSLFTIWNDTSQLSSKRLAAVSSFILVLKSTKADSALSISNAMYQYALRIDDNHYSAKALNLKGVCLSVLNRNTEALNAYRGSLKIYSEINDTSGVITENNNIGIIYSKSGKSIEAIDIYKNNQKISKIISDTLSLICSNINMAFLLEDSNYDSSEILIHEAFELAKNIESNNESFAFINYILGYYNYRRISEDQPRFLDSAVKYLTSSYNIYKNNKNDQGMAFYFEGIAELKFVLNEFDSALIYIDKALNLVKKIKGKGIPGNINGALFHWIPFEISTSQTSSLLYFKYYIYSYIKNSEKALEFFEQYHFLKDSVDKTSAKEDLVKYESEKAYEIKKQIDDIQHSAEIKSQKKIQIYLFLGIIIVAFFLIFIYKQLNTTKKQKVVIEEKQEEISDSINYAKRIQDAMMTSSVYLKDTLPKSFIFFKPKDVVSGDFYWIHKDQEENIFFTVADCTGHGVPGAFMSMIGTSLLNEIIIEKGIKDTDKILGEMRAQIIKSLNQEEDGAQKDGMDISMCKLNMKNKSVEFSGAHNSLIHVSGEELHTYRGDHQPVGLLLGDRKPFTKHVVKLKKDDMLYIYSDGYQDQFGGARGKKYMGSKFKEQLLLMSKEPEEKQLAILDKNFSLWMNDYEQIDDVCVMGVRVI